VRIYYGTKSPQLACHVQHLLVRLGIISTIHSTRKKGYAPAYCVIVQGATDQRRFVEIVGGFGQKRSSVEMASGVLNDVRSNTNQDTIPREVWARVKSSMSRRGISQRQMAKMRGTTYGGTSHFSFAPSRPLLEEYAGLLDDRELKEIAAADVFWDTVVSVEPSGVEDVFDMSVPGTHNFVANGLIVHNSIEQDSDVVMFIYRDEVYNPDTEAKGEAELIVAKHRNGPTGVVRLAFLNQYTKFQSMAKGAF